MIEDTYLLIYQHSKQFLVDSKCSHPCPSGTLGPHTLLYAPGQRLVGKSRIYKCGECTECNLTIPNQHFVMYIPVNFCLSDIPQNSCESLVQWWSIQPASDHSFVWFKHRVWVFFRQTCRPDPRLGGHWSLHSIFICYSYSRSHFEVCFHMVDCNIIAFIGTSFPNSFLEG